ncbi:hypothetical protein [Paenibacillus sp. GP183]|uniref:hypothetical protein n=1 Tax=Paenibacillus sp. GP183 TaxID=1882751 RepID=UPI000897D40F|nr:hypothetical protein [Paenibacillus sp. GP183]SEC54180.1 hypothetical protein SAMN05443246_4449 [Paenibacillus sp. GP183]
MKRSTFGLIISVLLFLIFIVLAIMLESTAYLYIASILPIVIVPFLPDLRSSQYIRTDKPRQSVRLIKLRSSEGSTGALLVIAFAPGFVNWRKNRLYFNFGDAVTYEALLPEDDIVSMPVLKYDLNRHPRKKNWVGISLPQLKQRIKQLSYTTKEVNRLVIQLEDLNEVLELSAISSSSVDHGVQA